MATLDTTFLEDSHGGRDAEPSPLCLLVMTPDGFAAHALPPGGSIVIGRSAEADVRIVDRRASRLHARLNLGGTMTIEDLGSGNGTRVRGAWLEPHIPVSIRVGEAIAIGGVCLMLEHEDNPASLTGIWSHSTFESRAQDLCSQARSSQCSFGVGRIRVDRSATWADVAATLIRVFRGSNLLSAYGSNDYHVLFVDTDLDRASRLLAEARAAIHTVGAGTRIGLAWFPRDGRSVDALVECAHMQTIALAPAATDLPPTASPTMMELYKVAARAASGNINVLVLGETGVGKEVMAQAIHRLSPRRDGLILCLNCAGLGDLLESELFGYERGAFTGAVQAKAGLLETAHRGTVFLDEVGELSLTTQAKLLRVIDQREVTRLGGLKARSIDVRFISATNRDLEEEARRGRFRSDLLFRLNGISLEIPPLRERPEDLRRLCETFLQVAADDQERGSVPHLSRQAWQAIRSYDWPGNIRELRNVMARAVVLCSEDEILPGHLPLSRMAARHADVMEVVRPNETPLRPKSAGSASEGPFEKQTERTQIVEALAACAGNQSRAAKLLGMPRRTFVSKLQTYGIPRPQKP